MATYLYFVKESRVKIWGLTPSERIRRVLGDSVILTDHLDSLPEEARVLVFRGDFLFEDRLVKGLVKSKDTFLFVKRFGKKMFVSANVSAKDAKMAVKVLEGKEDSQFLKKFKVVSPETFFTGFHLKLRKFEPPFVLPVSKRKARELEDRLFD